jgi:hypothetical protein
MRVLPSFQKSMHSDAAEVRSTANLTVVNKTAWAEVRAKGPYLPERLGKLARPSVPASAHDR